VTTQGDSPAKPDPAACYSHPKHPCQCADAPGGGPLVIIYTSGCKSEKHTWPLTCMVTPNPRHQVPTQVTEGTHKFFEGLVVMASSDDQPGRPVNDQPTRSRSWDERHPLTGTDIVDFLILRHVCATQEMPVYKVGDHYFHNGNLLLPFVADGLAVLIAVGHLALGNPTGDVQYVQATEIGRVRYEDLCDKQGLPPYMASTSNGEGGPTRQCGIQWVFDVGDACAHVLAEPTISTPGVLVTRCGRELSTQTPIFSVAPSLAMCRICRPSGDKRPPAILPAR
jgi:hypothetical protein